MRKPPKCSALSVTSHGFPFFLLVLLLLLHGACLGWEELNQNDETLSDERRSSQSFIKFFGELGKMVKSRKKKNCKEFKKEAKKPFSISLSKSHCPFVYSTATNDWECQEGRKCNSNKGLALTKSKDKTFKLSVYRYSWTRPRDSEMYFCAGKGVTMTKKWNEPTFFQVNGKNILLRIENDAQANICDTPAYKEVWEIELRVKVFEIDGVKLRGEGQEVTLKFITSKHSDCFIIYLKPHWICHQTEKCSQGLALVPTSALPEEYELSFFDKRHTRPFNTAMAFCPVEPHEGRLFVGSSRHYDTFLKIINSQKVTITEKDRFDGDGEDLQNWAVV